MVSLGVGGLSCPSCTVPPLFSFLCLHSFPFRCFPFGVLPPYRVGWHVCLQCTGLLFGVAGGGLLRLFPQFLCAVFPAAGTLVFLGFSCSTCLLGWLLLCTLCQGVPVAVLSAWFAGGVPLLPFPCLLVTRWWLLLRLLVLVSSDARSHIPDTFASSSTPISGSWMVLAPGFSCALP